MIIGKLKGYEIGLFQLGYNVKIDLEITAREYNDFNLKMKRVGEGYMSLLENYFDIGGKSRDAFLLKNLHFKKMGEAGFGTGWVADPLDDFFKRYNVPNPFRGVSVMLFVDNIARVHLFLKKVEKSPSHDKRGLG